MRTLYIFCDESGNFDFSPNGTKYFTYTALATFNPLPLCENLNALRHDLLCEGVELERFHATEDKQHVRDRVMGVLVAQSGYSVDSIIVEKNKTHPSLHMPEQFYPRIVFYYLLQYVLHRYQHAGIEKLIIIVDRVEMKGQRQNIEKGIKYNLENIFAVKNWRVPYSLLHHESKSHYCLQAVDYCGWAIYVKWSRDERRNYDLLRPKIVSEFDIFRYGTGTFY